MRKIKRGKKRKSLFWLDQLADRIEKDMGLRKGQIVTISCGWSVSGPVHIGNLRSDAIIPFFLGQVLKERGYKIRNILIIYVQDRFKATPGQMLFFENLNEAEKHIGVPENYKPSPKLVDKYKGKRLVDVPDPYGCCPNWAGHFAKEAVKTFAQLGIKMEVITTDKFYKLDITKKLIKEIIKKRKEIISLLNRYRKTKPYPQDWQPISPLCPVCRNIADNKALKVDTKNWQVRLRCSKCGKESKVSLENAKLDWKLEWAALWHVFNVAVEPYGKDHATAGGSRDVCKKLIAVLKKKPPFGFFAEWIGKMWQGHDLGDMTSSGNILFTPKQFLEIAPPEMLRYFYLWHEPTRRFAFDFQQLYRYYDDYDKAERIYYGKEKVSEKEKADVMKAFKLAQIKKSPKKMPYQLPFSFAAMLVQMLPKQKVLPLLKSLGHIKKISKIEADRINSRLGYAKNWLALWAPEQYKIKIQKEISRNVRKKLSIKEKKALLSLAKLITRRKIGEKVLQAEIRNICKREKIEPKQFFRAAYLVLLGKESGPRLSALIMVKKEEIAKLLKNLA